MGSKMKKFLTTVIVLAAVAVLVVVCIFVVMILNKGSVGPEMTLPLLIICGVMMLLVTLALTAFVFSSVDLVDKTQALGLPEGSVRSVIALSLVLLFAILAVYLYSSMAASGKIVPAQVASEDMRTQLKQNLLPGQFVYEQASADGKGFTIFYRQTANPASEDFAKLLLAMIGTLVTAVASFYFGSKTAMSAQSGGAGSSALGGTPVIRGVNPSKVVRGTLTKLEITGDGLDLIKEVKAVLKDRQVLATEVLSSASSLKCSLAMDLDAPTGAWDLIVSDGSGKEAKLAGALIVEK
jgi:hypothetical protein